MVRGIITLYSWPYSQPSGRSTSFLKALSTKSAFEEFINYLNLDETHVIIADNASIHKNLALRRNGADILYTPPYESDSNPIELCFSQAKREFRERNVMLKPDVPVLVSDSVEATITQDDLVISCFRHVYDEYVTHP